MKEFEKWCKEQIPESLDCREIGIEERGMERGWRAALERIYYAGVLTDLAGDWVREELGKDL